MLDNPGYKITIEISDDLKRAIRLRVAMSGKTQKEVLHDGLMQTFEPEMKTLEEMEKRGIKPDTGK